MQLDRIGRIAMIAALTNEIEEKMLKETLALDNSVKVGITFISGLKNKVSQSFVQSVIGCALQNRLVKKSPTEIHGVVHAALDAFTGITHQIPADASIKLKVSIVTDGKWVAVGIYGDSAFYPLTNHERGSLGVMHL